MWSKPAANARGSTNCFIGCGVVFKLSPAGKHYSESTLYVFCQSGCNDGSEPFAPLTLRDGKLLGTTTKGQDCNTGVLFEMVQSGGTWQEDLSEAFCSFIGTGPGGKLLLKGDIFGVAGGGGHWGFGTVWKYGSSLSVLYDFCSQGAPDCTGGQSPAGGVISDGSGNLFGVTVIGGANGGGVVYELSP